MQGISLPETLDKALNNSSRIYLLGILAVNDRLSFNDLKKSLHMTDGNLSTHLKVLETAGLVSVSKSFLERKPNSSYSITEYGIGQLNKYIDFIGRIHVLMKQ